nr:cilia- and flagella-associated protein 61 isoform X4 [Pogona vitticeps]
MSSLSSTVASSVPSSIILSARRTESHDIPNIVGHMKYDTERLFGRINVIYLLEKANLAITIINQSNVPVAHAAFVDYPNWDIVDQAHWEMYIEQSYIQTKCTPLNTLFMHLFVTTDEYATDCCHEIMKTVFKTVPELHFILLFVPTQEELSTDLSAAFVPMKSVPGSILNIDYMLYVSHRHQYCPQLHVRYARVEDHDDLTPLFACHNDMLRETYGEYFLAELIEAQDEDNLAVVCEDDGVAVGFMSVCSEVNIQLLHECFDLGPFHGLCKPHPDDILKPPQVSNDAGEESTTSFTDQKEEGSDSQDADMQGVNKIGSNISEASVVSPKESIKHEISEKEGLIAQSSLELPLDKSKDLKTTETPSTVGLEREAFHPVYRGAVNAFCIQLFCIDEKHETRSLDFLNFVFNLFPDRDFCIISVPHLVPEFHLIQNFVRIIPFSNCTLDHELYVFHRSGLLKSFLVRPAKSDDVPAIEALIKTLELNRSMLDDLEKYISARRDSDGTPVQAFVADVLNQVVGISVIRNEMDIEYIQSHYNIEDFIYFSHHQYEEHGHLYHFALNPIFHHYAKHFMKEILRLAHKSCLYYPIYPQPEEGKFQNPCAHSLTSALHYMVPVRPRRQIVYPLEKLGINAPSKEVSEDQLKYALNHFNRKLSLEPKVSINARIVVVGASNVGISFLETLIFCPHLKFNNLTLISTHGLPGKAVSNNLHRRFLINSHCFNEDEHALMSLASWINVVVGKVTGIDRSAKHVIVSKRRKVLYDHLILCTGQQYQAFFNFTNKSVDYDTFKAVNDACLVFDGRLVIDANFHTNDISIRAAGPLTKFSNIYYANEWTHSNFSSKEVGFQLAATMLNLFDPTLEPVFEPTEDVDRLIPIYKGCKVQGGILPGRYNYVHIFKPGIPARLDVQETQPNYGMAITTGDAVKGNYFRIHVNQYSMVETITCFSKEPVPASNYICLFGQHERLLNNLCSRWREGLITNLYSYLKEPWALAIYHDRFIDLQKELRQILVSAQEEDVPPMQEIVRQVVEGELTLHERPKSYLKRAFKQTVYKDLLEKSILNYLSYNNYHLPMFAWPGIV